MPRRAVAPVDLLTKPFSLDQARAAGLTRWHLDHGPWRRLGPVTYAHAKLPLDLDVLVQAAMLRLPPTAVFCGRTAGALHGLVEGRMPQAEVIVAEGCGVHTRVGITLFRRTLSADEIVVIRGRRATSVLRTLRDMAQRLTLTEAVVVIDVALQAELIDCGALEAYVAACAGLHGIASLRRAAGYARRGAESPQETRLRMLLALARLPEPEVNPTLLDMAGKFLGRVDLYYPEAGLGIEYDGATHRDSLEADLRRQNRLLAAGLKLLRFTALDLRESPDTIVAQVRTMYARRRTSAFASEYRIRVIPNEVAASERGIKAVGV